MTPPTIASTSDSTPRCVECRLSGPSVRPGERGFTIIELLVATAVMLVITAAAFRLVDPANGVFRAQPEVADMQQRMRVGSDMLNKDLLMAGAGTYSGAIAGTLLNFFAPVLPYRVGAQSSDAGLSFFTDRITIIYVPNTASQTTIREPMPQPSSEIKVNAEPGCPSGDPLCGFEKGMRAIIFDDTGSFDMFTITEVQSDALHLQHRPPNPDFSKKYTPAENARIAQVETHVYYLDAATNQLRHYDGWVSDMPIVDNVVGLEFTYYGDPNPPTSPRPLPGLSNCVFDATGTPKLPTLSTSQGSLVELTPAMLKDGPTCGLAPNQFDADLYRLRKIGVRLRMQAALRDLRGSDPGLFVLPGTAASGNAFVPDFEMTFEVTPRNMNLTR